MGKEEKGLSLPKYKKEKSSDGKGQPDREANGPSQKSK
jgi:hypothetical protein